MLNVVCGVCLATSVLVVVRWAVHRVDALGRTRGFPVLATGVPLALALVGGIPAIRHAQVERRLADVASQLTGIPVTVRCETIGQAWTDAHPEAGYVMFGADGRPARSATLTWQTCTDLESWLGSDRVHPSLAQVVAVHVLTHESMHMAGLREEDQAECAAVQRDVRTAGLLGATPVQARALAVEYWTAVYPLLSPDYRSPECRPDGLLDEHTAGAPWAIVKSGENS
jgi:hypothetical protein